MRIKKVRVMQGSFVYSPVLPKVSATSFLFPQMDFVPLPINYTQFCMKF